MNRMLRRLSVAPLLLGAGCAYAVIAEPGSPLAEVTRTWRVSATEGWQDTGVFVSAGDTVRLRAQGIWRPEGSTSCTAAGAHYPLYRYSPLFMLFYLPNPVAIAPINELLGRVGGDGQVLRIGLARDVVSAEEGHLQLRPNDWYLSNGSGFVDVAIQVERARR